MNRRIGLCISALMGVPAGVVAAPADGPVLEEVVVTARKQQESLQETPLTVNAFTEAQIAARGIESVQDLAAFTPGLTFLTPSDRSAARVAIRGMSQITPSGDTTRDIASFFIDGIYYSGTTAGLTFTDIERVEVIKGPQSAYFGRSTFAGAINFVTKAPAKEFGAEVGLRAAQFGEEEVNVSIEGPIGDHIATRLAGGFDKKDGQYTNAVDGKQLGEEESTFAAWTTQFDPTDNLTARLRLSYTKQEDGSPASQMLARIASHNCGPFAPASITNSGVPNTLYCGELKFSGAPSLNDGLPAAALGRFAFDENRLEREFTSASLSVDYQLPNDWTISSLSGYQDEDMQAVQDFDRTAVNTYFSEVLRDQHIFTQELRLASSNEGRLRWMGGLYYLQQDYVTQATFIFGQFFGARAGTNAAPQINPKDIENTAAFGSISLDFAEDWTLSLEGRYQIDKIATPRVNAADFELETKTFLPRAILEWRYSENGQIYVNVAKGNQPTQGNPALLTRTPAALEVFARNNVFVEVPEATVVSGELGAKTSWRDDSVIVNVAAFYSQWNDKQDTRAVIEDFNGDGDATDLGEVNTGLAATSGDETVYGFEIETRAQLTQAFQTGLAVSWHKVEFDDFRSNLLYRFYGGDVASQTADAKGREEGLVPELSGTLYGEVRLPAPTIGEGEWVGRADVVYVGSRWASILEGTETGASTDVNLRFGYEGENVSVGVYGLNVFDDDTLESIAYQASAADDPFLFRMYGVEAVLPKKRQFGITASYRF